MNKTQNIISWVAQVVAAVILAQTLFFKFTAAPESVYIFSTLGIEPVGRIGSGVAELIAAILLLIPRVAWAGGVIGMGVMAGAILSHLTKLGIEVQGDGGELFGLAVIVLIACGIVVFLKRKEIPILKQFLG
jgi:putative oxidoreductase